MNEKKRPPRFDDIAARSHRPPLKRPAVSPFALAYDAEEARKADLAQVIPTDLRAEVDTSRLLDTNNEVDTTIQVDTNKEGIGVDDTARQVDTSRPVGVNLSIGGNRKGGANQLLVDTNVGAKPANVDTKTPTQGLTPTDQLTPTLALTATDGLTPKKKNPPSWRMSRLSIRLDRGKLEQLHFVAMSRGITLQDLIGGWADAFLADEGLAPTARLTPNNTWHPTDQMTDDVAGISTSLVLQRPEELLAYYAKWTGNSIRESDWQAMRLALSYTPTAIKAGVLMSILRTKTKVNSFKYCLGAIDEVAKAGIVGTNEHLRYLEMKVEKAREGK